MTVPQGGTYQASLYTATDLSTVTVTCTVTAPDGTVTLPTVRIAGTIASCQVPASQIGTWLLVWTGTGGFGDARTDQFTVRPAVIDLISLTDLKDELLLTQADVSKDAKLRRWITAANDVVENVTGPIRPQTRTDRFDGGTDSVLLTAERVAAVTTVTEWNGTATTLLTEQSYGTVPTAAGYVWDRTVNSITRRDTAGYPARFRDGVGTVQVVYRAGLPVIPDDIQIAAAELIRHWYRRNDVPFRSGPFAATHDDDIIQVGNYLIPNAVMELLTPWRRTPEVA